jgi:uncharacterized protein (TIGR03790 family)
MTYRFARLIEFAAGILLTALPLPGAENAGSDVVVIYNSNLRESREVADYYSQQRQVPKTQIFGFDLPTSEVISRKDYLEKLEQPLVKKLEQEKLFVFGPATNRYPEFKAADPSVGRIIGASIRYAVLCYGVPVKIQGDPTADRELFARLRYPADRSRIQTQRACGTHRNGRNPDRSAQIAGRTPPFQEDFEG